VKKTIVAGLALASDWFKKESCKGLFGTEETRANGYDPLTVMNALYSGGDTTLRIGSELVATAFVKLLPAPPLGVTASLPAVSLLSVGVLINMSYVGNDSMEAALTMVHEMGHVYNAISAMGGSQITRGLSDDYLGGNDDRLIENCVK
jgi:hypothetical protein